MLSPEGEIVVNGIISRIKTIKFKSIKQFNMFHTELRSALQAQQDSVTIPKRIATLRKKGAAQQADEFKFKVREKYNMINLQGNCVVRVKDKAGEYIVAEINDTNTIIRKYPNGKKDITIPTGNVVKYKQDGVWMDVYLIASGE